MEKPQKSKYDLEERTFDFAKNVTGFCRTIPSNTSNLEYAKQVIRSSGSVGANYIEANECLGKKDFAMRIRICRKEAKESMYWMRLLAETNLEKFFHDASALQKEADELRRIFSAILTKTQPGA